MTCQTLVPEIDTFWREHGSDELVSLTVLADADGLEDLQSWRQDLGASYTVLWDVDDAYTQSVYGVRDRPQFLVLDRDHTIVLRELGADGLILAEEAALTLLGGP